MKKIVLYPIEVPVGDYCWKYAQERPQYFICEHFDNEGGHETCGFGFYGQKRKDEGVLKAGECLELLEFGEVSK